LSNRLCQTVRMNINNPIRYIVRLAARCFCRAWKCRRHAQPQPEQLDLGLDQITEGGLRLREALPIRCAEYWLQLGQPDLALKELETLPETVRQHPWPLRVQLAALSASNSLAT
jgi:hypothetical protein